MARLKRGSVLILSIFFEIVIGVVCFFLVYYFGGRLFNSKILSLYASLVVAGLVDLILFVYIVYFWWAPRNLFFTFIPEGRAKIVVRGDEFKKALMSWQGYTFDDDWNVVPVGRWVKDGKELKVIEVLDEKRGRLKVNIDGEEKEIEGARKYKTKIWEKFRFFGGLRYYGFWPFSDIYLYDFEWVNVLQNGELKEHPRQTLDYILLKIDVYWAKVEKAEDIMMLPLDVELVLVIKVINPYKALFRVQNWLETVINRIRPAVRDALTEKGFEEWIKSREDLADAIISDPETKELLEDIRSNIGVEVIEIGVKSINPTSEKLDRVREATLAKYLAEKEKERITIEADAEVERIRRTFSVIESFGEFGKLIRTLEALEKSPKEGSRWVISLPGVFDILAQILSQKKGSPLTPDEIISYINQVLLQKNASSSTLNETKEPSNSKQSKQ